MNPMKMWDYYWYLTEYNNQNTTYNGLVAPPDNTGWQVTYVVEEWKNDTFAAIYTPIKICREEL